MTPGLKTDYRSAALPNALPGPLNMCVCMHIYYTCVSERACVYAGDGWTGRTEDGEMGGFTCMYTCMYVRMCDPACVCVTLCARME